MNKFSNLQKLPPFSNYALDFLKNIYKKNKFIEPTKNLIESYDKYQSEQKIIIEPILDNENYPERKISELNNKDECFILTLNVIENLPNDLNNFSQVYFEEKNENKLRFNYTLFCRENPLCNKLIKLVSSSKNNEGVRLIFIYNFLYLSKIKRINSSVYQYAIFQNLMRKAYD